jgi:hypothetical protein
VAGASLGARRGTDGDVCTKTGVDTDGRMCASKEASASPEEALLDALEVALCLATEIMSLEGCNRCRSSRAKTVPGDRPAEKVQDLYSRFATLLQVYNIFARPPCPNPKLIHPKRSASATPR